MNREEILENILSLSARDLVDHILDGTVTFDELVRDSNGQFAFDKRQEVEQLLRNREEEQWNEIRATRAISQIEAYIQTFPNSPFISEAEAFIIEIRDEEAHREENEAWQNTDKTSIESLHNFMASYPNSRYNAEATRLISEIEISRIIRPDFDRFMRELKSKLNNPSCFAEHIVDYLQESIRKQVIQERDILEIIRKDHNIFKPTIIQSLIELSLISYDNLITQAEINPKFIQPLYEREETLGFPPAQEIDKVDRASAEIYFWGLPASGKTCALGSILSTAENTELYTMNVIPNSQGGFDYMNRLISAYKNNGEVFPLFEGTQRGSSYLLEFDLIEEDDTSHPISCIDISGEMLPIIYKKVAGQLNANVEEDDEGNVHYYQNEEEVALERLTNMLRYERKGNRKIHFFVVEYGGSDKLYEGLGQKYYLENMVKYIDEHNVFTKSTDAIFILMTKADQAEQEDLNPTEACREELLRNYNNFTQSLKRVCRRNNINNGELIVIPFTLGEVCFRNYCLFDNHCSENVLRALVASVKGFKSDGVLSYLSN